MNLIFLIFVTMVLVFLLIHASLPDRSKLFKKCSSTYPEFDIKKMQGMTPGGMYAGITTIPGDPDGKWITGENFGLCPACEKGDLLFYWQNEYYHLKCDSCGYLHDTGQKLTPAEKESMDKIIEEVHQAENFSRG